MNIREGKYTVGTLFRKREKNQTYFMTLLRLAEVAEDGTRNEMNSQPRKPPQQPVRGQEV